MADIKDIFDDAGFATVMDIAFYTAIPKADSDYWSSKLTLTDANKIATLETLKMTSINVEGPSKQATGGKNNNVLLNYGKSCNFEGEDALGDYNVLTNMLGAKLGTGTDNTDIIAITDEFNSKLTFVGSTFVIDKVTGKRDKVYIIIPYMLPQSIFNLTQEAEGDISTFAINGAIQSFAETAVAVGSTMYTSGGDKAFYFLTDETGLAAIKAADMVL